MKKTKIVCTIGPASDSEEILEELMLQGMNIARLNFSHGSHEEHRVRIKKIKRIREKLDLPVAILLDTKGPEIRLGEMEEPVELEKGQELILTTEEVLGNRNKVHVDYIDFPKDVSLGGRVLIDDGLIELHIKDITEKEVITEVYNPGCLSSKKGVNVPFADIHLQSLTDKDVEDIIFGIEMDIDFIAASFVRKREDVLDIKRILEEHNAGHIGIVSKIESGEGIDNLDSILEVTDGLMVARGDLGVEIDVEKMPIVQKDMIRKANECKVAVITATQMLDSMIRNPRPTRAEVADIANAILDGTDAVMLSGETAAGDYPIESVRVMRKTCETCEESEDFHRVSHEKFNYPSNDTTSSISQSAKDISEELKAKAIISATTSGATAKAISRFRPLVPIIATTYSERIRRQLSLYWGVFPVISEYTENGDKIFYDSIQRAKEEHFVDEGDLVILTAGLPVGIKGSTNLLKVERVATILGNGIGFGEDLVSGRAFVYCGDENFETFKEDDLLFSHDVSEIPEEILKKAKAFVIGEKGLTSDSAILGISLGKPMIISIEDFSPFESGEYYTLALDIGVIYEGQIQ